MPLYDVACPEHGVHEVFRHIGDQFSCEAAPPVGPRRQRPRRCFRPVEVVFTPESLPQARIDAAGDPSTDPRRIAEGTAHINVGLPGVDTEVGRRPDGSKALAYRPLTTAEVSSNRKRSELAKRAGLIPMHERVYRPLGGRSR